jgi:hypothetical protein
MQTACSHICIGLVPVIIRNLLLRPVICELCIVNHYFIFRALLFGGMRESQQSEIELKGTSLRAFKGLLKYIYTGHMSLANQKVFSIIEVLENIY